MKTRLLIIIAIIIVTIIIAKFSSQSYDFAQYDSFPSTCNNSLGDPNGNCFVNAFEKCETAMIKNKVNTVEGDAVFFYAQIIFADGCDIFFKVDDSRDAYGNGSLMDGTVCFDVRVSDNEQNLEFLCDDEWYGFPLY